MKSIAEKFVFSNKKFIILLSIFLFTQPIKINSFENKDNSLLTTINKIQKNDSEFQSQYILGTGDTIFIEFEGIQDYSKNYSIDPQGNLSLPELNQVLVAGLTLKELKDKLILKYQDFIINPNFNLKITSFRTVSVYISGEVNSPGLYSIEYRQEKGKSSTEGNQLDGISFASTNNVVYKLPNLFNALTLANGVTNNADLSNVKITRKNSITQGGGRIKTEINLLELITNGDQTKNIRLLDSDYIFVPKSENVIKDQIIQINKTNLNPGVMTVYMTGNIPKNGQTELKKGTSLVQAIAANGGTKILTGNVEFLRFNKDGLTEKRTFRYNRDAKISSERNPILMDGDIINVRKTLLGTTTEVLGEITSPIVSGYGLYSIVNEIIN